MSLIISRTIQTYSLVWGFGGCWVSLSWLILHFVWRQKAEREKSVKHFSVCGSECPDKTGGVYEYCKRLPPYSLLHVMMEFKLGRQGGPTLSLPEAWSYVGIINSRVLTASSPNLSSALSTLQIINYFYCSTFLLSDTFLNFIL